MVNEYNTSAANQGIPRDEMHAVVGNLIDPSAPAPTSLSGPEFEGFNIAAVGMGWHHFTDPSLAAKRLSERLKTGGVLLIIDFLPHGSFDGHSHSHAHTHGHDHGHGHTHSHGHGNGKSIEEIEKEHPAAKTVTHMGFSEEDTRKMFEEAGVGGGFEYVVLGKGIVFGNEGQQMKRSVFMAKGNKI